MRLRHLAALVLLALAFMAAVPGREPRQDPATKRVRVLYIGDYVGGDTPARVLEQEPLLSVGGVPATLAWYQEKFIQKFMRIYMPRTYQSMTSGNDVIVFSDAGVRLFEPKHMTWFRDGVVNDGMGLVMIGGVESFGAEPGRPAWIGTTVADILPVEGVFQSFNPATGSAAIVNSDDEFIESLPWETFVPPFNTFYRFNDLNLKDGATLLAVMRVGKQESPFLVTWAQGGGQTFAMGADWTPQGGVEFMKWDYYGDYASNLMLYLAAVEVPSEHELRHVYKSYIKTYEEQRVLLVGTIDFIEKFNANTKALSEDIGENEARRKESERLYIEQDFQKAVDMMEESIRRIEELTEDSLKLRERALLWVYVIEYLVVTATSLIAGVTLYTLMVRRRLYREVEITRGRGRRL